MARKTVESVSARAKRAERVQTHNIFASRSRLTRIRGPLVTAVPPVDQNGITLPGYASLLCGETFLIRRLNLIEMVLANAWPKPITAQVRRLMQVGNPVAVSDSGAWNDYIDTCVHLVSSAVIVTPPEVVFGDIGVEGITMDMCRPMFVLPPEEPGIDQFVLLSVKDYRALELEVDQLRTERRNGGEGEGLEDAERRLEQSWTFHLNDFATLAGSILTTGPGGLARFRQNGREPGGDVGSVADTDGDGEANVEPVPDDAG